MASAIENMPKLKRVLERLACKKFGHKWQDVPAAKWALNGAGKIKKIPAGTITVCARCGERKRYPHPDPVLPGHVNCRCHLVGKRS